MKCTVYIVQDTLTTVFELWLEKRMEQTRGWREIKVYTEQPALAGQLNKLDISRVIKL